MVAIFTGLGSGMDRSSVSALGSQGLLGSASLGGSGEQVLLNAATGGLMISRLDEFLVGVGPDASVSRTYNSMADTSADDNGDQWRQSTDRRVYGLTGTSNSAGSTIKRMSGDGSEITYTWSAVRSRYVTYDGEGAYDTLSYSTGVWTWEDGQTGIREAYGLVGTVTDYHKIVSQTDRENNAIQFAYDTTGKRLATITTQNGEYIQYGWNAAANRITSVTVGGGSVAARLTSYTYDSSARLKTVTVDLTPGDTTDNRIYSTTYTYDGSSRRVASISQSDGSQLAIEYTLQSGSNAVYRVTKLTQTVDGAQSRVTTVSYAIKSDGSTDTTIKDPSNNQVVVNADVTGNLIKVQLTPFGKAPATSIAIAYTADGRGNVDTITDELNNVTSYDYTTNGVVRTETDRLLHITRSAYNAANQLVAQSQSSADGGTDQLHSTRYIYDDSNPWRLAYTIDATGGVESYSYNTQGLLTGVIRFVGARDKCDLTKLPPWSSSGTLPAWSDVPTSSTMNTWVGGQEDKSQRDVKAMTYDARGNVAATELMNGTADGSVDRGSEGWIDWTYDQSGRLTAETPYGQAPTTTSFDGLGRVTSSTDANGGTTTFAYQAGGATVVVTLASGLVQTSVRDATGALVSYAESGTATVGGTSTYAYDRRGLLRRATDATGKVTWYLYDQYGRKIADVVSQDGTLATTRMTEYKYDKTGRPIAIIQYENAVRNTQALNIFTDDPSLADLQPIASNFDRWIWRVYDAEGNLLQAIDGDGVTTVYSYDRSDQLILTRRFGNALTAAQVTALTTTLPSSIILPQLDTSRDTSERIFYDAAGRVSGTLDAAGYLTETTYDAGGRKVSEVDYADPTPTAQRSAGTLTALRDTVKAGASRTLRWVYDGRGDLRYAIDPVGHVIEYDYHTRPVAQNGNTYGDLGQVQRTITYDGAIGSLVSYDVMSVAAALSSGGASSIAQKTSNRTGINVYDTAGRVAYAIDTAGTVTRYGYDTSGNLTSTTVYKTQRTATALPLQSQMDSWVSANANPLADRTTRTWYDARGQVRFVADAENAVTESLYDAEGRLTTTNRYATRLSGNPATISAVATALAGSAKLTSTIAYDSQGLVTDTWDATGVRTNYAYSVDGKLTWEIHGYNTDAQTITARSLDAAGRLIDEYEAFGTSDQRRTHYQYDGFGNLVAKTDANNETSYFYYDDRGLLTATRDAENFVTKTDYNAFGEVTLSTRFFNATSDAVSTTTAPSPGPGSSAAVTYNYYDQNGRLTAVQDSSGYFTEIGYDAFGDKVMVSRHAIAVALGTSLSALLLDGRYSPGDDATTYSYYDKTGRLRLISDAENYVTEYRRNAFGDVTSVVERSIKGSGATATAAPQIVIDNSRDQYTYSYYDELGQVIAVRDAMNFVTEYTYDTAGNVVMTTRRAKAAGADVNGYPSIVPDTDHDAVTYTYYDGLGRVVATRDPEDYVVETSYDSVGNVHTITRRSGKATNSASVGTLPAYVADPQRDATTTFLYDRLSRLKSVSDAENNIESYTYDAVGNRLTVTNKLGGVTTIEYDGRGLQTKETTTITWVRGGVAQSSTVVNTFAYDSRGNRVSMVEAANVPGTARTTRYIYDLLDRLTQTVGDAVPFTGQNGAQESNVQPTETVVYDAFGNQTAEQDANGAITLSYYDRLNRRTAQVDAAGTLTTWSYDADGDVVSQRTYATQLIGDMRGLPTDPSGLTAQIYRFFDMTQGRMPTSTEVQTWLSQIQGSHANDAPSVSYPDWYGENMGPLQGIYKLMLEGDPTAQTPANPATLARLGATDNAAFVRQVYRCAFRREATAGEVTTWSYNLTHGWTKPSVITFFAEYPDHRAVVAAEIARSASGGAAPSPEPNTEYRETTFVYDKNDRLKTTTVANVRTGAWSGTSFVTDLQSIVTTNTYDASGNLVAQTDGRGQTTYYFYDRDGRQTGKIDQEKYLTVWDRDADGNVTSETRFSGRITQTVDAATDIRSFRLPWFSSADDRVTDFTYDRAGRRLTETRRAVANYLVDDAGRLNGVNDAGQMIAGPYNYGGSAEVPSLTSPQALVYRMYDMGLGRAPNAGEISYWLGRLAANGTDMNGLAATCAQMLTDPSVMVRFPPPTSESTSNSDFVRRIYQTAFRRQPSDGEVTIWVNNINAGWSRGAVFASFSEHQDHRALTDPAVVQGMVSDNQRAAKIVYQYNALGEVVSKQETNLDTTNWAYDSSGRQTRVSGQQFGNYNSTPVHSIVDYSYNQLDELTTLIQNTDRTTTYTYGTGGRLTTVTDAAGNIHNYGYDADGHQVSDAYRRQVSVGGVATFVTEARLSRYDAAGRVISQVTVTNGTAGPTEQLRYTAFGEVAQRSINGVAQDLFAYDNAGNLWSSRTGDGAWRYYVADAAGNQTLTIESDSAVNFAKPTLGSVLAMVGSAVGTRYTIGQTDPGDEIVTITTYDARGQATATIRPTREVDASGTKVKLTESSTYNAFGEVTSQTDANSATTDYSYTATGRLSAVRQATVDTTMENGSVVSARPTSLNYYDISGRLVGTRDGEGNLTTYQLLAGTGHDGADALVYAEHHADGGTIYRGFTVYGELKQWGNESDRFTVQTFDSLSHLTSVTQGGLTDTYVTDLFGQRIQHTTSATGSTVEETDYDAQGRVTRMKDLGGDTVLHGYLWNGTIAVANLGTQGGWDETTTYQNNGVTVKTATETADTYGHVTSRVGLGGQTTSYSYDAAGRMLTATTGIETITESWYNTGQLKGVPPQGRRGVELRAGDRRLFLRCGGPQAYREAGPRRVVRRHGHDDRSRECDDHLGCARPDEDLVGGREHKDAHGEPALRI